MRWGVFFYTVFYLAAILSCAFFGLRQNPPDRWVWWCVTAARAFTVIFFTAALYFTIYGHKHYKAGRRLALKPTKGVSLNILDERGSNAVVSFDLGALLWRATRPVGQPLKPLVRLDVD